MPGLIGSSLLISVLNLVAHALSGFPPAAVSTALTAVPLEDCFEVASSIYPASGWVIQLPLKGEQGSKSILEPCVYWENTNHFKKISFVP